MKNITRLLILILIIGLGKVYVYAFVDTLSSKANESLLNKDTLKVDLNDVLCATNNLFPDSTLLMEFVGVDTIPTYTDEILIERLSLLNSQTPMGLVFNDAVKAYIEMYVNDRKVTVATMLARKDLYFPLFEEKLDQYNLPLELKYLPVVESALNASACSRSGAKGLWQFMYNTGKIFDLKVTSYTDLRCDPLLATVAACEYLSHLYERFDDWSLALAAYNAGPGTVSRAIYKSGHKDYWSLRPYLPKETRGYVPAFIAVNYAMNYATQHGIEANSCTYNYFELDTLHITQAISFEQIAASINISEEDLRLLNPRYKKDFIPLNPEGKSPLCIPAAMVCDFIMKEEEIYDYYKNGLAATTDKTLRNVYTVQSGDNLGKIAGRYQCTVEEIQLWNNLWTTTIFPRQQLIIYTVDRAVLVKVTSNEKTESAKLAVPVNSIYHTIQSGDTLWDIAKLYDGVTVEELKKLNNINNEKSLKPGMKIIVNSAG